MAATTAPTVRPATTGASAATSAVIAGVLSEKYVGLLAAGWSVTRAEIRRDLGLLLDVAP